MTPGVGSMAFLTLPKVTVVGAPAGLVLVQITK